MTKIANQTKIYSMSTFSTPMVENLVRKPMDSYRREEMDADGNILYDDESVEEEDVEDRDLPLDSSTPLESKKRNKIYPNIDDVDVDNSFEYKQTTNIIFSQSKEKTSQTKKEDKPTLPYKIVIAIFSILVLFFGFSWHSLFPSQHVNESQLIVDKLIKKFGDKPLISYRILKKSLEKVLNTADPTQPAILMLVSSKTTEDQGFQFAKCLASYLDKPYSHIDGSKKKAMDEDQIKVEIGEEIQQSFDNNKLNVLLLQNLDHLPGKAAMILHNHCDHENAEYKRSVFILTISSDEDISADADSKQMDLYANTRLQDVWQSLPDGELSSLLSRITVSVVGILPYSKDIKC